MFVVNSCDRALSFITFIDFKEVRFRLERDPGIVRVGQFKSLQSTTFLESDREKFLFIKV